jgi:hypothetical protein
MDPLELALAPDGIGQAIQAIPDETADALDTSGSAGLGKLVSHRSRHIRFLQALRDDGHGGSRARRPVKIHMRR